ncbi:MAG: aminotransferase class V-fold PLP-dependent enzyme [Actinobacteria bacterium]|nr:aminotransferase class V-fold PLP-dependent enzyme [Actinomycetota bacterium]
MSWASERARFPVLREHAYLNAGTFGPLSDSTLATMRELRDWEAAHGRGGKAYFEEMLDARERVRVLLAAQIGVPAEHVALTESTTQGVHIVVMGLGLGASDEVVTTDAEHFGLTGPLVASGATLKVARAFGAPLRQTSSS